MKYCQQVSKAFLMSQKNVHKKMLPVQNGTRGKKCRWRIRRVCLELDRDQGKKEEEGVRRGWGGGGGLEVCWKKGIKKRVIGERRNLNMEMGGKCMFVCISSKLFSFCLHIFKRCAQDFYIGYILVNFFISSLFFFNWEKLTKEH